ncbi:DNA-binding NarL/FixJ family response regulator [Saccharothrix ecbatanensis]|uniref:DNA-binding NarL/FixJ family response regulator n=1 Tax=Saccharothrix ecbatanensis TaxID=1105145 RepID=A0A7W9HK73_9PSEU|nr:LuxR family transcriptional regulator [Saccharothrix ecbatanensis]MBB5803364.1 DNA-binding NarL/FixJ family response regulator [Saccharothrix ecbatanensis]
MRRSNGSGTDRGRWFRTSSPVLIGRGEHLAALREAVARPPAVVLLEGEAGVGKSRLVSELLAGDLGGVLPLVGYCWQVGEPFSYGALLEALRGAGPGLSRQQHLNPVIGALAPLLPEIASELPAPLPSIGDPRAERHRLFRAVRELLAALGPVLLVVEDLHWADDGTRQLLRFLAGAPPADLGMVLTYRREDLHGGSPLGAEFRPAAGGLVAVLEIEPLDVDGVRRLTEAILGAEEVSVEFSARLHERTAGIPFVVEETLRALRDPEGAVHAGSVRAKRLLDAVKVPVLLRDAMADRLATLPAATVRVVEAAAVLGTPVPAALLADVGDVPEDQVRTALVHALDGHVLYEVDESRYGFRHILARQAVYDTISAPQRDALHHRAVDALEHVEPRPLVQLAEHSERAGRKADWLTYGEAAADRAIDSGDAATATALLQRLLAVPVLSADLVDRLAIKLGRIANTGLDQHDPTETLGRLLTDPRLTTSVRGEVRLQRAFLLLRLIGRIREGRAELERAVEELAGRPDLVARATAALAVPSTGTVPPDALRRWQELAKAHRMAAAGELRISLLASEVASVLHQGHLEWLDEVPDHANTLGGQQQLARLRCNVADVCVWLGHLDLGVRFLRDGLRLAAESGAPWVVSIGRTTETRLDWITGRWDGLVERVNRLIEEYRDITANTCELDLVLGWLAAARGDWVVAEEHFGRTGARDPDDAIVPVAISGIAGLASILLERKEAAEAAAEVDRGLTAVRKCDGWQWVGSLAPVAVAAYSAAGRTAEAERLVEEVTEGIVDRDAPIVVAALAHCRGALAEARGEPSEAVEHFREAAARYEVMPAPYFAALAREREATVLAPSERERSVELLTVSAETFAGFGASKDAARCRHALHSLCSVEPARRGRQGYGNDLSPREVEIARMVAAGQTNREIAEKLFLSSRTVEHHVARLFRKLGINSRAELRADRLY